MRQASVRTSIVLAALVAAVTAPAAASTQTLEWAGAVSGPDDSFATAVAADDARNVYATGSFNFTADFDPGPGESNLTADCCAIFISKLGPSGSFVWAVKIGQTFPDDEVCLLEVCDEFDYVESLDLALDGDGNVYVAGNFQGTVDFDPGPGTHDLTGAGGLDVFLLKLDTSGNFVWARRWGGSGDQIANRISVDEAGNAYTAGSFIGVVDFDPGEGRSDLVTVPFSSDAYVSKLDAAGNFVWARAFGGPGYDVAEGIDVDDTGNVFAAGYFELAADFDPATLAVEPVVAHGVLAGTVLDVFVVRLDPAGDLDWVRGLGGSGYDDAFDLALDGAGNVHTIGVFCGADADFDPGPGSAILPSAGDGCETFVSKLDSAGSFVWARAIGGADASLWPEGIAVDDEGDVFAAGDLNGTADFDPGPGTFELTGVYDAFFARLDASGELDWAGIVGGPAWDRAGGVANDAAGDMYGAGYFSGTADMDPGPGIFNLTAPPNRYGHLTTDAFVLKLASPV